MAAFIFDLSRFNWVDCLILIITVRTIYVGLTRGIFTEVIRFSGALAALVISFYFYDRLARVFSRFAFLPNIVSMFLSFSLLAFLILLVFAFLQKMLKPIAGDEAIHKINRWGGAIIGLLRGLILSALVLNILLLCPLAYLRLSVREYSFFSARIVDNTPILYEKIIKYIDKIKKT